MGRRRRLVESTHSETPNGIGEKMSIFNDTLIIFQKNTKIIFALIVFALLIGILYYTINPLIDTLMGAIGY